MNTQQFDPSIMVRCKPFSGFPMGNYRIKPVPQGIAVYDSVAKHFTTCHSLSPRTVKRLVNYYYKETQI